MVAELRWILVGLSFLLLGGIWWWGSRRAAQQSPGNAELREASAARPVDVAPDMEPYADESLVETVASDHVDREWGVSPFEPLSIRTADYDKVPVLDGPMMVHADPMDMSHFDEVSTSTHVAPPHSPAAVVPTLMPEPPAAPASAPAPVLAPPNVAELQRIVTVRVCADGDNRWSGAHLMAALESHGLGFGRYQVFHRKHADGRSLFCVASLIEPGTFDIAAMPENEFRGVTLFAVLPGPLEPVDTIDELFATAQGLAEEMSGSVQDSKGMPLSPQRASAIRSDVARFQALLAGA